MSRAALETLRADRRRSSVPARSERVRARGRGRGAGREAGSTLEHRFGDVSVHTPERARLQQELKELLALKQELLDDVARAKREDRGALTEAVSSVESQIGEVFAEFRRLEGPSRETRARAGEVYGVGGLGLVTTGRGSGGRGPVVYDDPEFAGTPAHRKRMTELGGNLLASRHTRGPKEAFSRQVKERRRGQEVIENLPETIKQSRERLARWPVEIAEQTVKSGAGFSGGFIDGMSGVELTDDQRDRLLRNLAVSAVLMPGVYAGMTYGIAEEVRDTLVGLLDIEEASAALSELVGLVLSPGGEAIARELGFQVAGQVKGEIDSLIEMSPPEFGFALGRKAGPILAAIALAILSGGVGAGARMVGILNKIPRGRRLIARLRARRKAGSRSVPGGAERKGEGVAGAGATQETVAAPGAAPAKAPESFAAGGSRLAPALEAPDADAPTWYSVSELDQFQRPTGVEAVINQRDLPGGPRPANPKTLPAGTEKGIGYEITHLGADTLGFPTTSRNLTTASGQTNRFLGPRETRPPTMRRVEMDIERAIRDGQTVRYRVTAIYDGDAPYPTAFHMQASGSGPNGLQIDTVIRNWTHHPE